MILKWFKSNQTPVLGLLPLLLLCLWMGSFTDGEIIEYTNASTLFQWINLQGIWANKLLGITIVTVSGAILNEVINTNEVFDKNTYLISLCYILIMSVFTDWQWMHPIVYGNFFLILAYRRLLNVYNQLPCKSEVFDAALLILIATLFTPTYFQFFPLVYFTLGIFRPFDLREYLMPILAAGIVLIYIVFFQYVLDVSVIPESLDNVYTNFQSDATVFTYCLYILLMLVVYLSGYHIVKKSNTGSLRFRKITTQLGAFLFLGILALAFEKLYNNNDAFLLFLSVPLSIMLSFYFYHAVKKKWAAIIFYTTLLLLVVNIYWHKFIN